MNTSSSKYDGKTGDARIKGVPPCERAECKHGVGCPVFVFLKVDGGVERIGITGREHLRQLRVGELDDNLGNLPLDCLRAKEALFCGGAKLVVERG
jgi:hypothetical protein